LARIQADPPNGSASLSAMKLQVTASLRPRAAAARRTRRSIICSGVAVGRATPGVRRSGSAATLS
jgi:hypothetical protein